MPEYNPVNERFKKDYEEVLIHAKYRDPKTVNAVWKAINLFENFNGKTDFVTFNAEQAKDFKRWLEKQNNQKGEPLSLSTVRSTLSNLRDFFTWLSIHPQCRTKMDGRTVSYLRMSNNDERAARATREKDPPAIEEVRQALEAMPSATDIEKRNRAIMAFIGLTGIRDDALITLKLKDIHLDKSEVWQNPKHVRTKRRKGITTFFMAFDPLWQDIVTEWIDHIQTIGFEPNDPMFPKELVISNPDKMSFESAGLSRDHWASTTAVRDIFKRAFTAAGLPYYKPHLFRDMLVHWAMKNCSQIQFKAVSQNVGHESVLTTYNSYGTLSKTDQRKAIQDIGNRSSDLKDVAMADLLDEIGRRTNI